MVKEIPVSPGRIAFVDDEDFDMASQYKWYAQPSRGQVCYAQCRVPRSGSTPRTTKRMHRLIRPDIMGHIDHIDGNGLNNTRANLRPATTSQNMWNSPRRQDNTSGFKGVSYFRNDALWFAQIVVNRKTIYLGSFRDKLDAARAYDEAAVLYFGEFARPNFSERFWQALDETKGQ